MKKEQVLEIGPYPGPLAADIHAVGAGRSAQAVHERKDRCQLVVQSMGQPEGFIQFRPLVLQNVF